MEDAKMGLFDTSKIPPDFKSLPLDQQQKIILAASPFTGRTYTKMKEDDPVKADEWANKMIAKSEASNKSFLHNPIGVGQKTFDKTLEIPGKLTGKIGGGFLEGLGLPKEMLPILLIGGAVLLIMVVLK